MEGTANGGGWLSVACKPRGRTRTFLCDMLMYTVSGLRASVGATRGEPLAMAAFGTELTESTLQGLRDPQIVRGRHHAGHVERDAMGRRCHPLE